MASFNKVILVGYLGRDPELRYTPQGTPVCDFSLATTERKRDRTGETRDSTTWFKVTFWGKQAETASQYLAKGRQVYVEGRLNQREWQDREGVTRTTLEVTGSDLRFLGSRGDEPAAGPAESAERIEPSDSGVTDDDIPF